jgi:hypothetical protein
MEGSQRDKTTAKTRRRRRRRRRRRKQNTKILNKTKSL